MRVSKSHIQHHGNYKTNDAKTNVLTKNEKQMKLWTLIQIIICHQAFFQSIKMRQKLSWAGTETPHDQITDFRWRQRLTTKLKLNFIKQNCKFKGIGNYWITQPSLA